MHGKSAKQILIDARQSLIDNGLTTGTLVEYKPGTKDLCFCSLGHIAYAAGIPVTINYEGRAVFDVKDDTYSILNSMEAVRTLADEIEPGYDEKPTEVVYEYNDRWADHNPNRIIKVFDKAIAAYG